MSVQVSIHVEGLGHLLGFYIKSSENEVHLENVIMPYAKNVILSHLSIDSKFIIELKVISSPTYIHFTDVELEELIKYNIQGYSDSAERALHERIRTLKDSNDRVNIVLDYTDDTPNTEVASENDDNVEMRQIDVEENIIEAESSQSVDTDEAD